MTPRHRLRVAGQGDAAFLAELFTVGRTAMFAPLGLSDDAVAPLVAMQWRAQSRAYAAAHPAATDAIVEVGDARVGRILVEWCPTRVHLVDIALRPEWTGHGIGTAVVGDLVEQAAAHGLPVVLEVARDNHRAVALYRRLGFVDDPASTPTHLVLRHPAAVAGRLQSVDDDTGDDTAVTSPGPAPGRRTTTTPAGRPGSRP